MLAGQKGEHDGIWAEHATIHSYDADVARKATVECLFRYFQEAAWNHAEHLGVGYSHLRRRDLAWVLSRMTVVVDTFPEWGQPVVVRTWPRGAKSLLALRDFELLDESRSKMLGATSGWIVLNLRSRRPQRLESILGSIRTLPERRSVGGDPERLASIEDASPPQVFKVHYSDLDLNDHVNNATYARWVLDSYPVEFHRTHRVRSLSLNFLAELNGDDSAAHSRQQIGELRLAHTIRREIDGVEACRAEVLWHRLASEERDPGK